MRAIATCLVVLVATGDAVAGRSFYGWLPATDIVRDGGTEVETWIAEEDDEGPTHLRETVLGSLLLDIGMVRIPAYIIEKNPRLRGRQGQYLVMGMDGRVLKRGHDLRAVLRVLEPRLSVVGD